MAYLQDGFDIRPAQKFPGLIHHHSPKLVIGQQSFQTVHPVSVGIVRHGRQGAWKFGDETSIEQYLCEQLDADFLGDASLIRLRFDDAPQNHPEADVLLFVHHGKGAAQTVGGHLLAPEKVLKWIDADMMLLGHDHAKIPGPSDKIYLTPDNALVHKTCIVARTGGYLKGYEGKKPQPLGFPSADSEGSYVEKALLPPSSIGSLCFSLGYEKINDSRYYRPVIHGSF